MTSTLKECDALKMRFLQKQSFKGIFKSRRSKAFKAAQLQPQLQFILVFVLLEMMREHVEIDR